MTNVNENIFEIAVRNKMRFPFKGMISVEDLWDLSLQNLDQIFKTLNSQLKKAQEESLLNVKTKQDEELDIKIDIIKFIVKVKQEEENLRLKAKELKEQKQKLLEIYASKQDADLLNKSAEEIKAMIDALNI